MKQLLSLIVVALSFAIGPCISAMPSKLSAATDSLNEALAQRETRLMKRLATIDSMKVALSANPTAEKFAEIGAAYYGLNTDSALTYYDTACTRAESEGKAALHRSVLLRYADLMPKIAQFTDALQTIGGINPDSLDRKGKIEFYGVRSHIYLDAVNYHSLARKRADNIKNAIKDLDSLAALLPEKSIGRRITEAQKHLLNGHETMAAGELNEVLETLPSTDPIYAIVSGMLASVYRDRPDKKDEYMYYLTLSAAADARNANGEEASLMLLGSELFKQGDIDRAFKYISASAESLRQSGARMLISEIAPPMSVFAATMQARDDSRNLWVIILAAGIVIIAVASGAIILHNYRLTASKASENQKLSASVSMRDQYINQLLELCSVYVEGLEDFNRLVGRKLKANQVQDLLKVIESGKMLQDQTERFFDVFDTAIFNIFPNFLAEINALLQPDKQMTLPETGKLSPELRIAAFMRLGITDSNRLSKFLGLSLNTVYTYRNRLKGRAISRENFENAIQNIG